MINKKVIVSWILVIIWAGLIFFLSSMDNNESNMKSKQIVNVVIEKEVATTSAEEATKKTFKGNEKEKEIKKLNIEFRKFAHAIEFFVLIILLIIALSNSGITGKKLFFIALIICFLYACSDEYHQTFVNGRTGRMSDVLIDTVGGMIGCVFAVIAKLIFKRKEEKSKI